MERRRRSLLKSVTWRIIAFLVTFTVAIYFTGSFKESFFVSFVANFIKMFLYYFHERAWNNLKWGRVVAE